MGKEKHEKDKIKPKSDKESFQESKIKEEKKESLQEKEELDSSESSYLSDATDTVSATPEDAAAPSTSNNIGQFTVFKSEADVEKLLDYLSEYKHLSKVTKRSVDFKNLEINGFKGQAIKKDWKKLRMLCLRLPTLNLEIEIIRSQYTRVFKSLRQEYVEGCPRKPTPPIFIFMNKGREKMRNRYPNMSLKEITKILSVKWKSMGETKRQKYKNEFEEQKRKYEEYKKDYFQKHPELDVKKSSNKDGPKKPINAFFLFLEKHRKKMRQKYPDMSLTEITSHLAEKWKLLDETKRQKYKDENEAQKKIYGEEMKTYLQMHPELVVKKPKIFSTKIKKYKQPQTAVDLFILKNRKRYADQGLKGPQMKARALAEFSQLSQNERQELENQALKTLNDYMQSNTGAEEALNTFNAQGEPKNATSSKRKTSESSGTSESTTDKELEDVTSAGKKESNLKQIVEEPTPKKSKLKNAPKPLMMSTPAVSEKKKPKTVALPSTENNLVPTTEKSGSDSFSFSNSDSENDSKIYEKPDHVTKKGAHKSISKLPKKSKNDTDKKKLQSSFEISDFSFENDADVAQKLKKSKKLSKSLTSKTIEAPSEGADHVTKKNSKRKSAGKEKKARKKTKNDDESSEKVVTNAVGSSKLMSILAELEAKKPAPELSDSSSDFESS